MATNKVKEQTDYIQHGSDAHAALMGLRKAKADDTLQIDGWTLQDMTMFGAQATETFIRETLRQKVSELKAGIPSVPAYARPMWQPTDN